ncbi:sulfotransferase [Roseateles amylovorans]|uniref:Sulfotransferase n=1 Tax=Roseateles amylovorans TaxID=2978473 RepID=A0ABY6AUG8_9BURK|nr:sulfotransferase [Roseateles amylovorans]UXH76492.1 sulfotransferase [Roseateles amylovorans]
MDSFLLAIKSRRDVPSSELDLLVRRVVVILSSSRCGSSLFKEALSQHPRIASLDGELDPLLALSGNGFNQNSDSDCLEWVANTAELTSSIMDELSFVSTELLDHESLLRKWKNRLLLQFPTHFLRADAAQGLEQSLEVALSQIDRHDCRSEAELQALILATVFHDEPWRIGYYDGSARPAAGLYFDEPVKIEEPPFVVPTLRRRRFGLADLGNSVLLFKSPSDAYRIGTYEQLFPNAKVTYIHLTRGFAQSVNGLMDGWLYPLGFFSHDLSKIGCQLAIRGYSDVVPFGGKWWKFDLPRNWRHYTRGRLENVCLNQWYSAQDAILQSGVCSLRVSFEQFMADPAAVLGSITDHLGLPAMTLPGELPVKMATEAPRARRWQKRSDLILQLAQRAEVREMMSRLGYTMEPDTWV